MPGPGEGNPTREGLLIVSLCSFCWAGNAFCRATLNSSSGGETGFVACQLLYILCITLSLGGHTVDYWFMCAMLLCRENILEAVRRFKDVYGKK